MIILNIILFVCVMTSMSAERYVWKKSGHATSLVPLVTWVKHVRIRWLQGIRKNQPWNLELHQQAKPNFAWVGLGSILIIATLPVSWPLASAVWASQSSVAPAKVVLELVTRNGCLGPKKPKQPCSANVSQEPTKGSEERKTEQLVSRVCEGCAVFVDHWNMTCQLGHCFLWPAHGLEVGK